MQLRPLHRHRTRIALLAIACLLFQQLAVAAVACEVAFAETQRPVPCHGPHGEQAAEPDALCGKHCAPDSAIGSEARSGSVPAVPVPPFPALALPALPGAVRRGTHLHPPAAAPPPILRHTRLLI